MTLENISLCENGNIELCDNGNISFCTVLVELTHCNVLAYSSCDGSEASIITELEASHVGKVVRIGGVCYSVAEVESGTPVAVTIDEVYDDCAECCGDLAPCSCPCGSWPGAYQWDAEDEPCEGLLDEYELTTAGRSIYDNEPIYYYEWFYNSYTRDWFLYETRITSTAKAVSALCTWVVTSPYVTNDRRRLRYNGTRSSGPTTFKMVQQDWYTHGSTIELRHADGSIGGVLTGFCGWFFNVIYDLVPYPKKAIGQTPVGLYPSGEVLDSGDWGGVMAKWHEITVSEPAP